MAIRPLRLHRARRLLQAAGLAFLLVALSATADELPLPIREVLTTTEIPATAIALYVQDVGASTPLVAHNADLPMNPASVIKLVTTWAALEALGPTWRWRTEVYAGGPMHGDVLKGDLIIRGYGDPSITLERLWLWLRELRARGIRDIRGDLVVDRSHFDLPREDPAAFDGKPWKPYNAPPDALLVNFGARELRILPGDDGKTITLALDVDLPEGRLVNALRPVAGPCGDWKDAIETTVTPRGRRLGIRVAGPYPLACGEQSLRRILFDADTQLSTLFGALWTELGGSLRGRVVAGRLPADARLIARFESPPLAEAVRDINKFSNNVMARQLFLTLGAELLGPPATLEKGGEAVRAVLARARLDFVEMVLDNGSGLSRHTRISARHLARLLETATRSPWFAEFEASLPIVAMDGTMGKRLRDEAIAGRARIKSGSLDGVRAIAGYILMPDGRRRILVCIVNHPQAERARALLDAAMRWAAQTADAAGQPSASPSSQGLSVSGKG